MPGTVTVIAAPPGFGRAGRMRVGVDGTTVGKVRQGASLELTLDPGEHRFRVSAGGSRSKEVTLAVVEDGEQHLYAGVHHGLAVVAVLTGAALGFLIGVLSIVPVLVVMATPGSWFYLRVSARTKSAEALEDAEEQAVNAASGEPWWVNDPNLAKRYRRE